MKFLKILIPISILSLVFIFDYYNKYYKPNTSFDDESIFLYVIKDDSVAFRDSISKYIKSEKTFYKVARRLKYIENKKTGITNSNKKSLFILKRVYNSSLSLFNISIVVIILIL